MNNKYLYDIFIIIFLILIYVTIQLCSSKSDFQNKDDEYPNVTEDLKYKYINKYRNDGTYKKLPFKSGSRLLLDENDTGVLKNFRINNYINSYADELSYDEMNIIVETIMNFNKFKLDISKKNLSLDDPTVINYIHKLIFQKLISTINEFFKLYDFETIYNYDDKRKFQIKETKIIGDNTIDTLPDEYRLCIFNISVYRKLKNYFFTLQVICIYNIKKKQILFEDITIIGITEEEKQIFDDIYNIKQKYCIIDKKQNNPQLSYCYPNKLTGKQISLQEFEEKFNKTDLNKFYNDKYFEEQKEKYLSKFKCFLKPGFNESLCKSYSFEKKTFGIWDKPCENDNECPFFKANKNYVNSRGGCINGYCEMPLNVKRLSHHYYDTTTKPFCNNCKKKKCLGTECFKCCGDQLDRKKYPNLKSPDYIFKNDGRDISYDQ